MNRYSHGEPGETWRTWELCGDNHQLGSNPCCCCCKARAQTTSPTKSSVVKTRRSHQASRSRLKVQLNPQNITVLLNRNQTLRLTLDKHHRRWTTWTQSALWALLCWADELFDTLLKGNIANLRHPPTLVSLTGSATQVRAATSNLGRTTTCNYGWKLLFGGT